MQLKRRQFTLACAGLLLGAGTIGLCATAQPKEQVIQIVARKFSYSPSQLTLKQGVPVVLELTTDDVLMGFNAPDFQARVDILPGQVAKVRLVPDKIGTFAFLCDVFCGSGHETMNGTIIVVAYASLVGCGATMNDRGENK